MSDFFQNGTITTIQKVRDRPLNELEAELEEFSQNRQIVLLLPALYSEFESAAMPRIIEELKDVRYLNRIVLGLDRADREQFIRVKKIMSEIETPVDVVWNDGPRMEALYQELSDAGFDVSIRGKGRTVWMALGYILADKDAYAIALHDCDIVNYERELLARLVYPVVSPKLDFEFSKGYYARVSHKLYGRVTRLYYTPLVRSLAMILGRNDFLDFLDSFRYALSGEFAFVRSLARGVQISPTWGLEVSMLSEVYHKSNNARICQSELMESYEHKHQVLKKGSLDEGLVRMAGDIAKALFRVMSQDGVVMSDAFFRTLLTTYLQEARSAVNKYSALSMLNGLEYDRHGEVGAVEAFVEAIRKATAEFVEDPIGIPLLPAWVRIRAALPEFSDRLQEAVRLDNQEVS